MNFPLLKTICLALTLTFAVGSAANAELKLGSLFSDNMVLQRDMDLNIWGWADPGAMVTVKLQQQAVTAMAGDDGKWSAVFAPIQAGEAFDFTVASGSETITIRNCLAGEVWICSGQSNMEWLVANSNNADEEIAAAKFPNIRHVKLNNVTSLLPKDEAANQGWKVCSPQTAGSFTAVGYFFGRELHQKLDVPVGLINTSWGGTIVEAWTSGQSLRNVPEFVERLDKMEAYAMDPATAEKERKAVEEWQRKYALAIADESDDWKETTVDDSGWEQLGVPGYWTHVDGDIDGIGWYRRSVAIPADWIGKELALSLGRIDDMDRTYVNGKLVGENELWNADRRYTVPAEIVTETKLLIAIRVADTSLGGGIYGDAKEFSISAEGGEPISLAGDWRFKFTEQTIAAGAKPAGSYTGPNQPTVLYNAMVKPLVPYTFRGAIWYQGESNAGRAYQYRTLFPLLVKDWRSQWGRDFPFYWVQLANFLQPNEQPAGSDWAELREAQSMTLSLPNSGQALAIDIGEADDVHPRNKQDVGKRLALIALARDYGKQVMYSGPVYRSMKVDGDRIVLSFDFAEGLKAGYGEPLKRFEIAGEDQKFVWADAKIEGQQVVVSHADVAAPVAVRYAWSHNPAGCNLYNGAELPASPFRTDDWPGLTVNNK